MSESPNMIFCKVSARIEPFECGRAAGHMSEEKDMDAPLNNTYTAHILDGQHIRADRELQ